MKKLALLLLLLTGIGASAQTPKTIRQFLRMSSSDTTLCSLRGVVYRVRNAVNGNLYLRDGTGEVLIYGTRDGSGANRRFPELDVRVGDTLTLVGRRTVYDGKVVEMNQAILVAKSNGPDHDKIAEQADRIDPPTFKGQDKTAFSKWVTAHLSYPKDAHANYIEGTVKVKFVVGRDGHVQEVEVVKGAHPLLNEEAVRVIKRSPKWKPGKRNGQPVRVTYTIPVIFSNPN